MTSFTPHIIFEIHPCCVSVVYSFLIGEYYSIVHIYHKLFIHFNFIRHSDYFQFLIILNKADRNTHVQVFYAMFSLLLCKRVEVLGHSVSVFFFF